jgi:hypothetical protein
MAERAPDRPAPRLAWGILVPTVLFAVASGVLTIVGWGEQTRGDAIANLAGTPSAIVYAALGVLIIRRVGNRIGWVLLGIGLVGTIADLASAYSIVGVATHPGSLPAPKLVGAFAEWAFVPTLFGVCFALLVFPTGGLPSPRWRPVAVLGTVLAGVVLAGLVVTPRPVALPAPGGTSLTFPNPLGIESLKPFRSLFSLAGASAGLSVVSVLLFGAVFVALLVRYRSGDPVRRQQIKWLVFLAVVAMLCQLVGALSTAGCGCDQTPLSLVTGLATGLIAVIGIPAAITIAILRYRLYEIDRIINRALVYGLLTAILAGVYVGLAVGLGSLAGSNTNSLVIAGSTLVVAALFQPARRRIQAIIDRRFYRRKYDAQRTLEQFSARLRDQVDLDELHSHLLAVVDETVRPASMSLWLREAGG